MESAMRWMVFDDETAEIVVSRWRRGAAEILHEAPVDAALQAGGSAVLVMPSRVPGQVMVARFHKSEADAVRPSADATPAPLVVETPARKPWWRKFVA
jgi:hypothetical protein